MNMENRQHPIVAVIGAGNIGSAMARGLLRAGCMVNVFNRSRSRLEALEGAGFATLTTKLGQTVADADIAVLCVEGDAVASMVKEVGRAVGKRRITVVSCAAAPTLAQLSEWAKGFDARPHIARVLPNIAATCGCSVNLVCSVGMDEEACQRLCRIFEPTGQCVCLDEALFGPAMALSSCGIANALRYVHAAAQGAVELGLSPSVASRLAAGSLAGAAALLDATDMHPEALIDTVTTPGGLTIRGLNAMEEHGFTPSVIAGIKAASKR